MQKIGFGGSCHWCTEAIFRSLKGISKVEQGWIASEGENSKPSEAVAVSFDPGHISLKTLITIHLHTHSCTAVHNMRSKYRSAVYYSDQEQAKASLHVIKELQKDFAKSVITQILPLLSFQLNTDNYLDYYYNDPTKPFCRNIINPKLKELLAKFSSYISPEKNVHFLSLQNHHPNTIA